MKKFPAIVIALWSMLACGLLGGLLLGTLPAALACTGLGFAGALAFYRSGRVFLRAAGIVLLHLSRCVPQP